MVDSQTSGCDHVGGPGDFVKHDARYWTNPHPDYVAWGIGHILADFEHARKMGENGRREVERRFTWDNVAKQTADARESLNR